MVGLTRSSKCASFLAGACLSLQFSGIDSVPSLAGIRRSPKLPSRHWPDRGRKGESTMVHFVRLLLVFACLCACLEGFSLNRVPSPLSRLASPLPPKAPRPAPLPQVGDGPLLSAFCHQGASFVCRRSRGELVLRSTARETEKEIETGAGAGVRLKEVGRGGRDKSKQDEKKSISEEEEDEVEEEVDLDDQDEDLEDEDEEEEEEEEDGEGEEDIDTINELLEELGEASEDWEQTELEEDEEEVSVEQETKKKKEETEKEAKVYSPDQLAKLLEEREKKIVVADLSPEELAEEEEEGKAEADKKPFRPSRPYGFLERSRKEFLLDRETLKPFVNKMAIRLYDRQAQQLFGRRRSISEEGSPREDVSIWGKKEKGVLSAFRFLDGNAAFESEIEIREGGDVNAVRHLQDKEIGPAVRWIETNYLRQLLKRMKKRKTIRIVDLGFGGQSSPPSGAQLEVWAEFLAAVREIDPEIQLSYTAIDAAPIPLKDTQLLKSICEDEYGFKKFSLITATLPFIPLPSRKYDLVVFNNAIDAIDDKLRAVWEAGRILRKGGLMLLGVENDSLSARLMGFPCSIDKTLRSFGGPGRKFKTPIFWMKEKRKGPLRPQSDKKDRGAEDLPPELRKGSGIDFSLIFSSLVNRVYPGEKDLVILQRSSVLSEPGESDALVERDSGSFGWLQRAIGNIVQSQQRK
uniref:Methyltransferase type 11 domain-containing protein n=1 Tax=Chromera velia CCMP2878 TaxID=1169474 RepID=A0A0G4I4M8_9ALVE|eukprot:Cvel_10919.t1-p1 / transcript=Cvel_10919.t1 / gene=Cvel_10919 / organism=Chromera_velia_CCMP2878 / gene_product=hypothetical protein / transcript_product=hypothetical protein / location=Cvel_scaffold671:1145-6849(-) / protein_length=689 / sequence_SO=supercontig / SO=protein_coding / is_pseudo=false